MDLLKSINELKEEKKRIEYAIAALEAILSDSSVTAKPASRRGRKSMSEEERAEVSKRMKQYWRKKRQDKH
ncbi:MAG: hypothetical protein FJW20_14625 [Acidimicrobiia bacterium]|nr:hypothetical protein [Acidimicrobiia bacterium]